MTDYSELSTTAYGDILGAEHFMDYTIHALWQGMKRIAGPAFTVQLASGDNLMLHKAIYEAPRGSILVVDGVDAAAAVAGGNVCAVAQKNGIAGFVVDGVVRDVEEIEALKFPVYAKGLFPVPGKKNRYAELKQTIRCGGIAVNNGDIIVADRDGIAVLPTAMAPQIYEQAKKKNDEEVRQTLEEWEKTHRVKVDQSLAKARNSQGQS